jgi:arginase
LRPPAYGASPGVYKLARARRDNGLLDGLGALDGGVVVAPCYSDRIERLLDDGFFRSSLAATAVY